MKLVCVNAWGGRIHQPFLQFLKENSDIDIFCFHEIFNHGNCTRPTHKRSYMDIFSQIENSLPTHTGFFSEYQDNEEGLAIFYKSSLNLLSKNAKFIFRQKNAMIHNDARTMGRLIQYIQVEEKNTLYTIANVHGLWNGEGKNDSPDRITQSQSILNILKNLEGKKILIGDFNLLPDTKSLQMIQDNYRNLVKEYGITSTRSSLYTGEIRYADYAFVSEDVKVKEFKTLPVEISDHLPLFLEFA